MSGTGWPLLRRLLLICLWHIITHEELHAKILEIKQKQGIVLSGGC